MFAVSGCIFFYIDILKLIIQNSPKLNLVTFLYGLLKKINIELLEVIKKYRNFEIILNFFSLIYEVYFPLSVYLVK